MGFRVYYLNKKVIDPVTTGASARKFRKENRKTLRDVSEAWGVGISYICDLEHGRKPWNDRIINMFVQAVET